LLFLLFAAFGCWVDYVVQIPIRNPLQWSIAIPYVILYLAAAMFYRWVSGLLSRPLGIAYAVLFAISTVLNITSH